MKKNKKGFTLIEIIVCIVLIVLIGGVVVFSLYKNNNEDKEKVKIANEIISAADVYYSINEEMQERLKSNYGYLVIGIDELKKYGLLSNEIKIPEATVEEQASGVDYNKIVLIDRDYDSKYRNLSSDYLGYLDYHYPYEKNDPFIIEIPSLYIEDFEKNEFECPSGLDDGIKYVDEDYNVQSITNYSCEPNLHTNWTINKDSSERNYTTINYEVEGLNQNRYVYIYNPYDFELKSYTINNTVEEEYTCNTWVNKDVKLSIIDKNNNGRLINEDRLTYEFTAAENIEEGINKNYRIYKCDESETSCEIDVEATYLLKGTLDLTNEKTNETNPFKCNIKIDKQLPTVTQNRSNTLSQNTQITIKDNGSGLKSYYVSNSTCLYENNKIPESIKTQLNSLPLNTSEKNISISDSEHCVYVIDNAGNEKIYEYLPTSSIYPTIEIIPIENSFTEFKVTLRDREGISKILSQYTFSDEAMDSNKDSRTYEYHGDDFANNWEYDPNYEKYYTTIGEYSNNKNSMISNYDSDNEKYIRKEWTCNADKTECSYILNMKDQLERCIYSDTSKYGCRYNIDVDYLFNLEFYYYFKVTNTRGKIIEYKVSSNMNYFIEKGKVLLDDYYDNTNYFWFEGINEYGDIVIIKEYRGSGPETYSLYLYENEKNRKILVDENYPNYYKFSILEFTQQNFKYNFSYKRKNIGDTHLYNRENEILDSGSYYPKKEINPSSSFISNYDIYSTSEQRNFIKTYLNLVEKFEKAQYTNYYRYDNVYGKDNTCFVQSENGEKDYIYCIEFLFNNTYNNKEYNTIITYRKEKGGEGEYNKLFFIQTPNVVLEETKFIN